LCNAPVGFDEKFSRQKDGLAPTGKSVMAMLIFGSLRCAVIQAKSPPFPIDSFDRMRR
jgi:hypothetical protein